MPTQVVSVDRPRFFVIAISSVTGEVFRINDVEQMSVQKREDGSGGSWSFTTPLVKEYDAASLSSDRELPYAKAVAPMDLVALYAWRSSSDQIVGGDMIEPDPVSDIGDGSVSALSYGDQGALTVTLLGRRASCLMIGMVDSARISKGYSGSRGSLSVNGTDLTKVFLCNDTAIPAESQSAGATSSTGNPGFLGLQAFQISKSESGPVFIRRVLDVLVAKDLSSLNVNPAIVADVAKFGYPWRNFIRTDAMDDAYQPLQKQKYPPYTPQAGSVWTALLEIRNPPITRMFVTELGELIYDDQYKAWVENPVVGSIGPEVTRDFDSGFDDSSLVTFISVSPGNVGSAITQRLGEFFPGQGFVNGTQRASTAGQAQVSRFGYRFAQFISIFDIDYDDSARRQKNLLQQLNNIYTAQITVKGDARYRVGQRWKVLQQTGRKATTDQTWYIDSVSHNCQFGNDWTTTLSLKYPQAK